MTRNLSAAFKAALFAERTDEVVVILATIEHPSLEAPLRLSSDPTECLSLVPLLYGTVSRGEEYLYVAFEVQLPEDNEGVPPSMQLRSDNVGREQVQLIRTATTPPPKVTVEIVSGARPDQVEAEFPDFDLVAADYDEDYVTISLGIDAMATEPFPGDTFTPSGFRGLF